MRLVAQGSVFAFESEVTAVNYSGCKLLLSSFPKLIQSQVLRRDARFPCALTASCEYQGAQFKAVIVDISNGGCQMYLDSSDLALEIDEIKSQDMLLRIRLPVDEAVENINSTVMSVQKVKGHELSLGLAFKQPEKSINDYINSLQLGDMSALFL